MKTNRFFVLGLAGVLGSPLCYAEGTWFWQSNARVFLENDDNVRLSVSDDIDAANIGVSAKASISKETESSQVLIAPHLITRNYSSDQDIDNTALGVDLKALKNYERAQFSVDGKALRNTTLTSEFEDSGRVRVKVDRNEFDVTPGFKYRITPLTSVTSSVSVKTVDYADNGEANGYFDYDVTQFNAGLEVDVTRRDMVFANAYTSHYESDGRNSESDTVGARLGVQHKFTERTSGVLVVGGYELDSEVGGNSDTSTGSTVRAEVKHQAVLTSFNVSATSQLTPSSTGLVRQTDRLDASVSHNFTSHLVGRLSGTTLRTESTSDQDTSDDRDYQSYTASLSWRLDPLWSLSGSYRYADQKYDNAVDSATSNRFSISINYNTRKNSF